MTLRAEDFAGDKFRSCTAFELRDGDIVRMGGDLWQVISAQGWICSVYRLWDRKFQSLSAFTEGVEKRVGEPLPVEW